MNMEGSINISHDGETIARPVLGGSTCARWVVTIHDDVNGKLIGLVIERVEALYAGGMVTYAFIGDKEQSDDNMKAVEANPDARVQYHYHMVIHFAERIGLRWIANNVTNPMDFEFGGDNGGVYWLTQKGTNEQAVGYARKYDESRMLFEIGVLETTGVGKRTDIDRFKEMVMNGQILSYDDALDLASGIAARSKTFVLDYIQKHGDVAPPMPAGTVLRGWQHHLQVFGKSNPDDRSVLFFVDAIGNSGKSWFTRHAEEIFYPKVVNVIPSGRVQDTATQVNRRADIIIMDIPREVTCDPFKKRVQYQIFEQIKNGAVFDSKFQSNMKRLKPDGVHLIVFMNTQPDMSVLSEDRYQIVNITPEMNRPYEPPLVPNFGSEFSSDMTGDGPSALDLMMSNLGADIKVAGSNVRRTENADIVQGNNPIYGGKLLDVDSTGHQYWAMHGIVGIRIPVDNTFTLSTTYHPGMEDYARRHLNHIGIGSIRCIIDLRLWPTDQMVFQSGVDMMTGFLQDDPSYMTPEGEWFRLVQHYPSPPGDDRMSFGNDHALRQLYGNATGNPRLAPNGYRRVPIRGYSTQRDALRMYVLALRHMSPERMIVSYDIYDDHGDVIGKRTL